MTTETASYQQDWWCNQLMWYVVTLCDIPSRARHISIHIGRLMFSLLLLFISQMCFAFQNKAMQNVSLTLMKSVYGFGNDILRCRNCNAFTRILFHKAL